VEVATDARVLCSSCGIDLAPSLLSCPGCRQLVHSERLRDLAARADRSLASGDASEALSAWRETLSLVPRDSRQYALIAERIERIGQTAPRQPDAATEGGAAVAGRGRSLGGAAGIGAVALLVLSKGKLLLLGLTKFSTLASMLLSFGVYWELWGWPFALGLVASIYVHEMGHVAALSRLGIRASAPAFIPGFGALVRMKQHPVNAIEDARVGLAGPIWGLGAALAAYAAFLAGGWTICAAVARAGAWINLLNLLPIMPLDGGRGFRALSRADRVIAMLAIGAAWAFSSEGLLLLLLLAALAQAAGAAAPARSDRIALAQYVALVAALSAIAALRVPHALL
jgi:Zn-dependent protease